MLSDNNFLSLSLGLFKWLQIIRTADDDDDESQHLYGAIYLFKKKHSKAWAPPIKLAFKCLKEDVSFEWSFEVVQVVNFANTGRWWEGVPQARSNRGKCPVSISLDMSNGHLESKARWAKSRAKMTLLD